MNKCDNVTNGDSVGEYDSSYIFRKCRPCGSVDLIGSRAGIERKGVSPVAGKLDENDADSNLILLGGKKKKKKKTVERWRG